MLSLKSFDHMSSIAHIPIFKIYFQIVEVYNISITYTHANKAKGSESVKKGDKKNTKGATPPLTLCQ